MKDGRIVEHGTHKDLVARAGEFARLDKAYGAAEVEAERQDDIAEDAAEAVTDAPTVTVADVKKKLEKVQYKSGTGKSEGRLIVRLLLIIKNATADCHLSLRKSEPLDLLNGVVSIGIDLAALTHL